MQIIPLDIAAIFSEQKQALRLIIYVALNSKPDISSPILEPDKTTRILTDPVCC
jgi:hypothetical protein